jgi:aryl carrier-like protein
MLPAAVTALDQAPAAPQRQARRVATPPTAGTARTDDAPTVGRATTDDDLTRTLCEIWTEVPGFPVDPDDDFFELGGNSLFAVRIGAALRARGLPSLRLRELYHHPTARATAANLSTPAKGGYVSAGAATGSEDVEAPRLSWPPPRCWPWSWSWRPSACRCPSA